MNSTFSFSYPWWYTIFCLLIGAVYALLMYYRDQRFAEMSPWFKRVLAVMRGLAVSLICLLLLSPFLKMVKEDIKQPLVILAGDKSSSLTAEKAETMAMFKDKWQKIGEKLGDKYQVKTLTFGEEVYEKAGLDSLNSKSTNIAALLQYIEDNYADQNLGAIVIGTDGIYNEGNNPIYIESKFAAPLYTVALGDTSQKKDLVIQNVLHNKIAYLGDKFNIQVDVAGYNAAGSKSTLVLESINGSNVTKIGEQSIDVNSQNFFISKNFVIDANQAGVMRFRARVANVPNESNLINNRKEFFVEVLDARQKILLLANAPHPDLAALKSIITTNKNYDAEIVFAKDFNGNLTKYNLVVLHNLPSQTADISATISNIKKNNIPSIYIVGTQTALPRFNQAQEVISISGNSKNIEEITGDINPSFAQYTTSDQLKRSIISFPPLVAPFGEYKLMGTSNAYMYQKIKKIKTNYPLIAFGDKNSVKTAVWVGEGIWKWRLFDHLQTKSYDNVTEMINKVIQLTSVKEDKRKFRAASSKNLYKESEPIIFDAQLYNDSYELVNDADVKMMIKDENNKEFNFQFSKTQNYYKLDAGGFPAGSYSYVASTNVNGKALTSTGRFNVESIQLEAYDLTARHGLLKSLSDKYNGHMFYPQNMESLADSILANPNVKPVMYQTNTTRPIIYLKWLFFALLALLAGEWFLRRYYGSY